MPVVNFAAGGIATPADAAYLMSLGVTESLSVLEYSRQKTQWKEQEQLFLLHHSGKMLPQ